MTLTLELRPELEAKLEERARAAGQALDVYVEGVLERELGVDMDEVETREALKRLDEFEAAVARHPKGLPILSPEDLRREHIYEPD